MLLTLSFALTCLQIKPERQDAVGWYGSGRRGVLPGQVCLHHWGLRLHGQSARREAAVQLPGNHECLRHDATETREERRHADRGDV